MSPNLEVPSQEVPHLELPDYSLVLTAFSTPTVSDQESSSIELDLVDERDDVNLNVPTDRTVLPLEHNLRELLVKVSSTENLETVTQLKLRVISREITLQHLSTYTPALRELILDGSMVSSLRDIGGYGLKSLRILRVNRCGLTCLDDLLGLEALEEIHASDNFISDLIPCTFLTQIKVIDLQRNLLDDINKISFLSMCSKLEHLYLKGNKVEDLTTYYRKYVKVFLPSLKTLDGEDVNRGNGIPTLDRLQERDSYIAKASENKTVQITETQMSEAFNVPRTRLPTSNTPSRFTILFPPKLYSERADTEIIIRNVHADEENMREQRH